MAMEKYILQAPNCWHQFSGRVVGVGVPKRSVMLHGAEGEAAGAGKVSELREEEDGRVA
jgi:1-phosphatidylinositol-3-phosphate 5-kinase